MMINSVHPDRRTKRKLRSPKKTNFINKALDANEVKKFVTYQEFFLRIISKCREIDINQPKVAITAFPLIKLNLATFLRFIVLHQCRHIAQAQEVVFEHADHNA
jgi:hypothetical protein